MKFSDHGITPATALPEIPWMNAVIAACAEVGVHVQMWVHYEEHGISYTWEPTDDTLLAKMWDRVSYAHEEGAVPNPTERAECRNAGEILHRALVLCDHLRPEYVPPSPKLAELLNGAA